MSTISYAVAGVDEKQVRVARGFYRASLVCGIVPMVAGVGILLAYWLTKRGWLVEVGFWTLPIGLGVVVLGIAAWIVVWVAEWRVSRKLAVPVRWRRLVVALLVLTGNFPVALICVWRGYELAGTTYVDVLNESGVTIDSCVVDTGGKMTFSGGPIAPGGKFRVTIKSSFWGDPINVHLAQGASKLDQNEYSGGDWVRFHIQPRLKSVVEKIE